MLSIAGVAALAVVLFAIPLAIVLLRSYRAEDILRLQRDTVAATRAIDVDATGADPVELPARPRELAVYDRAGRKIGGRGGPAAADAIVRDAMRTERLADRVDDGRVVVAVPLVVGERVTGAVRAEAVRAGRGGIWLALAGLALLLIGLSIAAAVVLARRLSRPLERLGEVARRLGEGDFAVGAPRSGVNEVDDVACALDTTAGRLDSLVSRERAFSADASHQLRTPLAALRLELEALQLRGDRTPELEAAVGQVDRLQETVTTLLAVARDTPRSTVESDLRQLLAGVSDRWHPPLGAEGRKLRLEAGGEQAVAPISAPVLREILDVLLDNALRHGAGDVTVTVRDASGALAIDVADQGPGVSGDPEAVFERRSGRRVGHGIGLALARSLAHAEGARLIITRAAPEPVFTLLVVAADQVDVASEAR